MRLYLLYISQESMTFQGDSELSMNTSIAKQIFPQCIVNVMQPFILPKQVSVLLQFWCWIQWACWQRNVQDKVVDIFQTHLQRSAKNTPMMLTL